MRAGQSLSRRSLSISRIQIATENLGKLDVSNII